MNALFRSWIVLLVGLAVAGSTATVYAASEADAAEEAGAAEHHQPNTNPLSIDPDLAIVTVIVFVVLLVVLGKFAWGPIIAGLEKREKSIADQIDEAKRCADKANATLQQYEAKLAAAADEVKAMIADARREAETAKEKIVAEAHAAAQRERERAVADIKLATDHAVRQLAQKSVDTAVLLAGRMLRKEVSVDTHAQLIRESLEQFPNRN